MEVQTEQELDRKVNATTKNNGAGGFNSKSKDEIDSLKV